MSKPKVLVTRRWPQDVEKQLSEKYDVTLNSNDEALSLEQLRDALSEYDAIMPTVTDKLPKEVFDVTDPRTKILANYGVGFSHIDTNAASSLGITVTNTPDVLSECTADIAMTLLLMATRRAGEGERELRANNWTGWRPTHLVGSKTSGKTLGIIGFGRIGQEMARRAHHGFGMKIAVFNRSQVKQEVLDRYNATQVESIDKLLPMCDFVSLHCPGGDENRHLINEARLKLMKSDAFLINTARGEVVDDSALCRALRANTIGGAGLDVFDGEPNINPDLLKCENAVLLPHLGSATRETREAMGFKALDNLNDFFEGRTPRDQVA